MTNANSGNVGVGTTYTPFSSWRFITNGPTLTITKDGTDDGSVFFRNGTGGTSTSGPSITLNSAEHLEITNSLSAKDIFFNVNVENSNRCTIC